MDHMPRATPAAACPGGGHPRRVRWTAPGTARGAPVPLRPPAGLGDLAELDGPWAHAAHHAAVAVMAGAVGDAHTWTRYGYPPPAAYGAPTVAPGRHPWPQRVPVGAALPAARPPAGAPPPAPRTPSVAPRPAAPATPLLPSLAVAATAAFPTARA